MITKFSDSVLTTLSRFDEWLSTVACINVHDIDRSFARIDQGKSIYYECLFVDTVDALGFVGSVNGGGFTVSILLVPCGSTEDRVSAVVAVHEGLVGNSSYGVGDNLACRDFLRDVGLSLRPALLVKVPLEIGESESEPKIVNEPPVIRMGRHW